MEMIIWSVYFRRWRFTRNKLWSTLNFFEEIICKLVSVVIFQSYPKVQGQNQKVFTVYALFMQLLDISPDESTCISLLELLRYSAEGKGVERKIMAFVTVLSSIFSRPLAGLKLFTRCHSNMCYPQVFKSRRSLWENLGRDCKYRPNAMRYECCCDLNLV